MKLAQRHMERDLLFIDPLKALQREIDAFPDADSRGTHQAESVDLQRIGEPKVLLQALILFEGKRSGQIVLVRRKVLAPNEVGGQRIALVGKGVQQTAELDEPPLAGDIAQRRIVLAEEAEPAEHMRITVQMGKFVQMGKGSVEIREKATGAGTILLHGAGSKDSSQDLDLGFEDLVQGELRSLHDIFSGEDKGTRWATARANSCQTSRGAMCT
jgi:hypothetical protein